MDKTHLIAYLDSQLEKTRQKDFDPTTWKNATVAFLNSIPGQGTAWAKQLGYLQVVEKMSYEELYPKKVVDLDATGQLFRQSLSEIADQAKQLSENDLATAPSGPATDDATLDAVVNALGNSLTGKQMAELKAAALSSPKNRLTTILDTVRKWDIETTQQIIADILQEQAFWK